ncbi:NAD-dependent 15-hydroxyprostaglandin dehydrogenase [Colletotrichum incanum]|nr:NAD-dependent 15-hydroxyprostaglandin dehydrogenase [Colletotrichum incanum]
MSLSVAGKYAVITGAGSDLTGINLAFAKLLLERGCSVMIGDLTLRPDASSLLAQYPHPQQPNRPSALFQSTNVSSWPQLTHLWKRALISFPRVDIVVPGAGIFEPAWSSFWKPPSTETNAQTESRDRADAEPGTYAVLNVNLTHPTRLSQLAIGYWTQERRKGCLVHTPLWLEDPEKKHLAQGEGGELFIEPEEIARGMLELCENPEYGDGTIFEVTKGATRVVPAYHAEPPSGKGAVIPQIADEAEKIWKELEGKGLKV